MRAESRDRRHVGIRPPFLPNVCAHFCNKMVIGDLRRLLAGTFSLLVSVLLLSSSILHVGGIKFDIEAKHSPDVKCIWNYALSDTLVIVTLNTAVPPSPKSTGPNDQRIDVEVIDGSKHNNIYLSKKNIKSETRMAINTHSHADLGVCVKNTLAKGMKVAHVCILLTLYKVSMSRASRRLLTWTSTLGLMLSTTMRSPIRSLCPAWKQRCGNWRPLPERL